MRQIIAGMFDIPTDLNPATIMVLEEIGKVGMKLVNGEGKLIEVSSDDSKRFWKKVNKFTLFSASGIHNGHYKAAILSDVNTEVLP